MSDAIGTTANWWYDARGRVIEEMRTVSGVSGSFKSAWGYNSADLLATIQYPAGNGGTMGETVSYAYHPQMLLNTATGSETGSILYGTSYEAGGRVKQERFASSSGPLTGYVYYPWTAQGGRLQQILNTAAGYTRIDMRYTYDLMGNVASIADYVNGSPQTQSFTYDEIYRLLTAVATGGSAGNYGPESYTYDGTTGNLASKAGVSYSYGDAAHKHAVTGLSNGNTYQYDQNGNMTQRVVGGQTYNLTYDAENHLVSVSGAATASFSYNGDGERVKAVVNGVTTAYVGEHYEWRGNTTDSIKYYFAGTKRFAMRVGTQSVKYLLGDHLGSTSVVMAGNGSLKGSQGYLPWGETRFGSVPTEYQFTAQHHQSAIGLYWYRSRFYDPSLGRFTQPDTIVPSSDNPSAYDRFSYSYNNPLRYIDPTGHWTEDQLKDSLGDDWREKYFGDDAVFHGREKLLEFLLSENTTDLLSLELIKSLFNTAYGVFCVGADFTNIDALGARFSVSGGSAGFVSGTIDTILNLTSGEISVFGSGEGGIVIGATGTLVGGITFIRNLPSNTGYRGVAKNIGLAGGDTIGLNTESFSGDTLNGGFVGAGGAVPFPNIGGYGSISYAFEVLTVDSTGYELFPYIPGPIEVLSDIGRVLSQDIFHLP